MVITRPADFGHLNRRATTTFDPRETGRRLRWRIPRLTAQPYRGQRAQRRSPIEAALQVATSDPGEPPVLDWIDVTLIDVDRTYQREADAKNVQRIVDGFRWDRFGAVVLSPQPDGRYHVTDGQHRVLAAQAHPAVTHVPAAIIHAVGQRPEATNFLAINVDRKGITGIDRFWAGLAAEDPICARVQSVVTAAGCEVMRRAGGMAVGSTSAVAALSRSVQAYGDRATREALAVILEAWPTDPAALRGQVILATARLIECNPEISHERLSRTLGSKSFVELTAAAEGLRKLSGGTAESAFARAMAEMYNRTSPKKIIAGPTP